MRNKVEDEFRRREIQEAHNIEACINGRRQAGHVFREDAGIVRCVGCGIASGVDWKGHYMYEAAVSKFVQHHGECASPWDLKKCLAEIEAKYAPKAAQGAEVTLESVNAKLDAIDAKLNHIIRHWGIYR